jgi:PAS domain S-box-containing protein
MDMKVKDIMTENLHTLHLDQTLRDAACIFSKNHIDHVPIVNTDGDFKGLITKSKMLDVLLHDENLECCVSEVMENNYIYVEPDREIDDLLDLDAKWLPVLQNGHLLGVVTTSDLARFYYNSARDLQYELEAVISSVHNAIISVDENGIVQIFNPAAERIFEVDRAKVIGRPLTSILPQSNLAEIVKTGRSEFSQKLTYDHRTLISNRTPLSVNGKIVGAVAVLQDVSELESISLELKYTRELKEELDAIFNSSFDGIYVTDGQGVTLRINDAYSRITGIQAEEVLGKSMAKLVEEGVFDQSVTLLVMERKEQVTITQAVRTGKSVLATGNTDAF